MLSVFNCLATEHDLRLVVLAGVVCLIASLAAVCLFHRALKTHGRVCAGWIAWAGTATGCGIWATHFIAMLAYEPGVAVGYNVALTVLSLLAAIVVTAAGLAVASLAQSWWSASAGGAVVGAGVAVMHYTGMAALEVPGRITWSADLVIASILFGIVFAALALHFAAHGRTARATLLAALLLTLAIVSHHFIAMGAVTIVPDATRTISGLALSDTVLAITLAGVTLAILVPSLLGAVMDRRLSENNVLLGVALNNMTHGLMMFDAEGGLLLFNQRYIDLYRLPRGSLKLGMTLREVIDLRVANGAFNLDPDEYCRDVLASIARRESSKRIVEMGDGRTIAVVGEPLAGGGWVATHQDITDERRREASFRFLFDANPVPMWVWDHETLGFLAVNQAAVEKYGYDEERFRTLTLRDIKRSPDWDSIRAVRRGDERPLRQGIISQHAKADGSVMDVEVYGRSMVYEGRAASLAASIDITERKRVQEELKTTREFLDTILESVPSVIAVKDARNLKYLFINRAAEAQYGLPREQVVGRTAHELFPAKSAHVIEARDQAILAGGGEQFYDTHAIPTAGLGKRYITSRRVRIDGDDAKPRYILTVTEDVTERKLQEDELRSTRTFLDTIIENMPAMLLVKNAHDLRYVLVNRAAEAVYGIPSEEMIGKTSEEVFPTQARQFIAARDRDLLEHGEMIVADEQQFETRNGTRLLSSKKLLVRDHEGNPQYILSLSEDVTDRKRARDQIAHMALHDPLTDLPNRTAFNDKLAATLEAAASTDRMFAVLTIDLDRFKEINDVFGPVIGDALLREVGQRLGEVTAGAYLARLGGDEFALIVAEGVQPSTAEAVAERLQQAMAADIAIADQNLHLGLSIGVAVYPSDGRDATALMANANAALYRAKSAGRGTMRFFEAHMDERLRERRAMQQELRTAIEQGELTLHYQPQARITGEIIGFEALVRWNHPVRGMIAPSTFIPLAEDSGLIVAMGEWILREVCREAASWPRPLQVAVNLSPVQFRHGDLPSLVHAILLETGLAPHRLELEVTEGVLINDFTRAVSILRRLKLLGISIAMDDFGTGYSSLSYLQSFPFDKIKIDKAFISNLTENHYSATIVRAVIGLGRGLHLPVMAEGVETAEQMAFLARESCDEVQGFYIGRPSPIEAYAETVGRRREQRFKVVSG
jgi:diguanylate cyclase (GGDEF)-like protein/PAS domain S-box-containing protein